MSLHGLKSLLSRIADRINQRLDAMLHRPQPVPVRVRARRRGGR